MTQRDLTSDWTRRRCLQGLAGVGAATVLQTRAENEPDPLDKIRTRGSLVVGLYTDMPPFHVSGAGIDVDLAKALADELGLKLSMLPFPAGENMDDDLRNMVWKGHYLGYGPADVLMHVPVNPTLMNGNPRVEIFAPYYRERLAIARNLEKVPVLDEMSRIAGLPVAVPGQSLSGWLLLGAENGAYREQMQTRWADGAEAAQALMRGDVPLAAGMVSELESVVRGDKRFAIEPLPLPRAPRDGWAVGMAVKKDSTRLAQALQGALNNLVTNGKLAEIFAKYSVSWKPA
ncbi:MAG: substrate-binding periplasmic protein [Rhizobacter sp.]